MGRALSQLPLPSSFLADSHEKTDPCLGESFLETGQVPKSVTHPGVLSDRITPVSGTQVTPRQNLQVPEGTQGD